MQRFSFLGAVTALVLVSSPSGAAEPSPTAAPVATSTAEATPTTSTAAPEAAVSKAAVFEAAAPDAAPVPAATTPAPAATPAQLIDPAAGPENTSPAALAQKETPEITAEVAEGRRLGDPEPLTRREPTMRANTLMLGVRYGLVGNGPTRFVDDVRYSITDNIELRTSLLPWPASFMARGRIGSVNDDLGAFILDGGLAYFDAGVRIVEDTGEPTVGVRFHLEGSVGWQKALGDRFALNAYAHYRDRISLLPDDNQHTVAVDAHFTADILNNLALSAGLGVASTIGTPVREVVVNFTETDRAGISHLLARDDGGEQSLTIPLTLTYGRVDSFDVDLFCTPRVYPEFGVLFGAGVRLRIDQLL